jgi:hypothetical protein
MATIVLAFEVTNSDFSDIVDTACNCIDYWADEVEFDEPHDENDPPAKLSISCEDGEGIYEVTRIDVEEAMIRIVEGKVSVCNTVRSDIESAIREDDYGYIDGYAADAIIQVACFGELIYG